MAADFIEERLDMAVRYGASWGDEFKVEKTITAGGREYRRLGHPYPTRYFNIAWVKDTDAFGAQLLDLYHRCYGEFAGFRVKAFDDYSTNGTTGTPTATDQDLVPLTVGSTYQLVKRYGTGTTVDIGRPLRTIYKPVAGTVLVAIGSLVPDASTWSVDTTTGVITFAANKTRAITAITKAAQAVVTVGAHTFTTADSVHFTGVAGMTQINGLRGDIVSIGATTITVDIDSTAFSTYTSGGTVNTAPQASETVKGGCEFDIPVRFNSRVQPELIGPNHRAVNDVELMELIAL